MQRARVAVSPPSEFRRLKLLFEAISRLFPVSFESHVATSHQELDGLVLLESQRQAATNAAAAGVRTLAFVSEGSRLVHSTLSPIEFKSTSHLDVCFHKKALHDTQVLRFHPLRAQPGDEI